MAVSVISFDLVGGDGLFVVKARSHSSSMPSRKRRSLQSLLIPGLFHSIEIAQPEKPARPQSSQFHTWGHSAAARLSPPPDFLQDEDPFANLAAAPKSPIESPLPSPPQSPTSAAPGPRSPLAESPTLPRKQSVPNLQTPCIPPQRSISSRPAYQKPAFSSRPSLPSLDSLARMNVIIPPRIRKGRVGASLPVEPWDLPPTPTSQDSFLSPEEEETPQLSTSPDEELGPDRSFDTESSGDIDWPSLTRSSSDHSLSRSSISSTSSSEYLGEESSPRVFASSTFLHDSPISHIQPSADILNNHFLSFPSFSHSDTHSLSEYPWDINPCTLPSSEDSFEPGTSASTVRASIASTQVRRSFLLKDMWVRYDNEPTDSSGWHGGNADSRQITSSRHGGQTGGHWSNSRSHGLSGGGGSSGGNAGDDDDRDNSRKPPSGSFLSCSSSEASSDDDESEDDYGDERKSSRPQVSASSDDDVPLAKSIPTALRAQRTIRIKAREEREQRRRERAERAARGERQRQTTLRSAEAAAPNPQPVLSSSQEAAVHAMKATQRQRAQTLGTQPFGLEDLNKKLQDIQGKDVQPRRGLSVKHGRTSRDPTAMPSSPPLPSAEAPRILPEVRSFANDSPTVEPERLARSTTRSKGNGYSRSASRPPAVVPGSSLPVPDADLLPARTSSELERKHTKLVKNAERPRLSLDPPRSNIPPIPGHISQGSFSQQRIFIGDLQQFRLVEIGSTTTAGEVVKMVEDQGGFKGWVGDGGWMLYEFCQDFGMERPIRNWELLSDVESSWNKGKTVNTYVLRLTPLRPILEPSAMPSSSPIHSGYVEWEMKRGKWTKRWLILREHNLYLAKRDNGKDATFLCSLSNFDFYRVTRIGKTPKSFTFAIKSTDNLSFFEDAADYLHVFCCNEDPGHKWEERILLARSYVLHQTRNVVSKSTATTTASSNLTRAPTRKSTTSTRSGPKSQPLVNINPDQVFVPGSLLSKQ